MKRIVSRIARPDCLWRKFVRAHSAVVSGLCVLLLVSACAPVNTPKVSSSSLAFPREAATDTLATGFDNIARKYIKSVSVEQIAMDGLRGLSSIDPALKITRTDKNVTLSVGNLKKSVLPAPSADDAEGWANLAVHISAAGRKASMEMRQSPPGKVYEAIFDGALSSLDIFSRYAGTEDARKNRARRDGFGGIGIRFKEDAKGENGQFRIVKILRKTPAARSGLKIGDRITHVNNQPVIDMTLRKIGRIIRGPVKTEITLTALRDGWKASRQFKMLRAHIVPTTVFDTVQSGIIVLRIKNFNHSTTKDVKRRFLARRSQLGAAFKGLVLDLRGNPGGLLKQSVRVADLFLAQGDILSTRGRHPDSQQYYEAHEGDLARGHPIAVLIDGKSASAAEIVAAALQDRRRAVVIGTTSYGKGSVQTVIQLPNDAEITLTWSHFVTPSGYILHGLGVRPTLCTSGMKKPSKNKPLPKLSPAGNITAILTAWRKTPDIDEARRRQLRRTCVPERRRSTLELDMAKRILNDTALFRQALEPTGRSTAEHIN